MDCWCRGSSISYEWAVFLPADDKDRRNESPLIGKPPVLGRKMPDVLRLALCVCAANPVRHFDPPSATLKSHDPTMGTMVTVFKTAGGANKLIATDNTVVCTTLYKDLNVSPSVVGMVRDTFRQFVFANVKIKRKRSFDHRLEPKNHRSQSKELNEWSKVEDTLLGCALRSCNCFDSKRLRATPTLWESRNLTTLLHTFRGNAVLEVVENGGHGRNRTADGPSFQSCAKT